MSDTAGIPGADLRTPFTATLNGLINYQRINITPRLNIGANQFHIVVEYTQAPPPYTTVDTAAPVEYRSKFKRPTDAIWYNLNHNLNIRAYILYYEWIPCDYLPGDINGDGNRIGSDVTYGVRYFKGIGAHPPDSCYMDSTHSYLFVAADVNGDCKFIGSDITRLVSYFKGLAALVNCHFFPPPPSLLANPNEITPLMIDNSLQQPVTSPSPIQIAPGKISKPGKDIEQPATPVNGDSKGVEKSPLRKK